MDGAYWNKEKKLKCKHWIYSNKTSKSVVCFSISFLQKRSKQKLKKKQVAAGHHFPLHSKHVQRKLSKKGVAAAAYNVLDAAAQAKKRKMNPL